MSELGRIEINTALGTPLTLRRYPVVKVTKRSVYYRKENERTSAIAKKQLFRPIVDHPGRGRILFTIEEGDGAEESMVCLDLLTDALERELQFTANCLLEMRRAVEDY